MTASSSKLSYPAKYKSNCTEDDSKSTEFYRPTYICKDGADIPTGHKHTYTGHKKKRRPNTITADKRKYEVFIICEDGQLK